MANIHPTAIIDPSANIHPTATVGAYCIVGRHSTIGEDTILKSHVIVGDNTTIGKRNEIFQFASIGEIPQDKKFKGETTYLEVGDDNRIRESCTFHRGTADGGNVTKIGSRNLFMVNTHIAHDCIIGDDNIFANNVGIAGHAHIGNHVIVGGQSGVHQFCRIEDYAMVGGASLILKDVCAFTTVSGNPAKVHGMNKEGMKRKGWSKETIAKLDDAYDLVFRSGKLKTEVIAELSAWVAHEPKVQLFIDSLNNSQRGLIR